MHFSSDCPCQMPARAWAGLEQGREEEDGRTLPSLTRLISNVSFFALNVDEKNQTRSQLTSLAHNLL